MGANGIGQESPEFRAQRTPQKTPRSEPFFNENMIRSIMHVALEVIKSAVIGAAVAWVFTSISPLGGALLISTFTGIADVAMQVADNSKLNDDEQNAAIAMAMVAGMITVNVVATTVFPYLGMNAVGIIKASFFTICSVCIYGFIDQATDAQRAFDTRFPKKRY